MAKRLKATPTLLATGLAFVLAACGADTELADAGRVALSVWFHSGQRAERETIRAQINRFNAGQDTAHVALTIIPEGSYNGQVQAAALADDLPDVLEFDGPLVYNYAWQKKLIPMDDLLPDSIRRNLLPSIIEQGTYRGKLYSIGTFDSGLGLFARRSRLEAVQARIPRGPEDAWSTDEFDGILAALSARDLDGAVLDLKLNYSGEWFAYGFSPALQSAGGGLIDRTDYRSAHGVLNGPESVDAMRRVQSWIARGYVDANLDDSAFVAGRVALSWVGHWEYRRNLRAVGEDLLLLPLPDFGRGTRTGQGSWNWGITTSCRNPEAAMQFLAFLLQDREILAMTDANGAVPATRSAVARSELYRAGGPLHLYVAQLAEGYAIPRPRTPGYPIISSAFERSFRDIRNAADVKTALDKAVAVIDQDIADNKGYASP